MDRKFQGYTHFKNSGQSNVTNLLTFPGCFRDRGFLDASSCVIDFLLPRCFKQSFTK